MQLSKKLKMKRQAKEPMDLDITSLLDILVILLVFLLQSYSASDLRVDLVENLSLPTSVSQSLGEKTVIVQINREHKMWVNDKYIGKMKFDGQTETQLAKILEESKQKSKEKYEELVQRSPTSDAAKQALTKRKENMARINLILDEELSYNTMRKLMHTSATSGYPEFKFIVRARSN